jgi:Fic family protein
MDPARFASSRFGAVESGPGNAYSWFNPQPIPTALELDAQTLLALSRADEALGRLAGVGQLLREPRMLMRPYAWKEALASSRIEGTHADLEEVFEADRRGAGRDADLMTVANYIVALDWGLQAIKTQPINMALISTMHRLLLGVQPDSPLAALRERPVWLGSPTDRPETAVYVPPIGDALQRSLADLEHSLASESLLPPLIRAALLHYSFLTTHPFLDGNGRAGRLLVLLFLCAAGRLPEPLLYLSPYFERRRREYYDRLQAVRERSEIQEWCQFFLTAVEHQANDGVNRARRLLELRERYRLELLGARNRSTELVEMIFENPVITSAAVKEQLQVTTQGAHNLIRSLENRGWLQPIGAAGRGGAHRWVAGEVLRTISEDLVPEP